MRFSVIIRFLVTLLLFVLPSWAVISVQISHFVGFYEYVTSFRYFLFAILFFTCFLALINKSYVIDFNFGFVILFIYFIVCFFHIVGDVEYYLVVEGFRHEVVFVLFSLLLLMASLSRNLNYSTVPSFDTVLYSIYVTGFFVVIFAVWQFFDVTILEFLYRQDLNDIADIKLAIGYRLTSTMVNPINFGSFIVLLYLATQYSIDRRKRSELLHLFSFYFFFLLVLGSLSRLAMLALIVVFLYDLMLKRSFIKIFLLSVSVFIFVAFFISYFDIASFSSRIETIFVSSTYTENDRVSSWLSALRGLDFYQFFWGRGLGASSPDSSIVNSTSAMLIENAFISVLIQYGALGFAALFVLFLRFIYVSILISNSDRNLSHFLMCFIIFFSVMCLGNDFLRNSPFVFYFWFFYVKAESYYYSSKN